MQLLGAKIESFDDRIQKIDWNGMRYDFKFEKSALNDVGNEWKTKEPSKQTK